MARKTSEKKMCLRCGKSYALSSFYNHRNPLIHETFGFCKKCVRNNIDLDDMDTLYGFLRTMDIPYLKEEWKNANESQNETIGTYFKNMNSLRQNKDLRFKDSDNITGKTNKAEISGMDYENFEVTDEMLKRWGRNLEKDDYIFLEEEFDTLGGNEAETTIQEKYFKNMARTQLMANKAYDNDDYGTYDKMMKTLSSQMQDANIKPVQVKSAKEEGSINSWSEWVKKIEETEPCMDEHGEYEPKFIKKYLDRFFVSQIKRVFGRIKDEDIKKLDGEK
ncbi:hypothetical protein RVS70_05610 [Virgibacillus sp. M23]|uniref:hypothetical protein n=1 Tax=Virgibacillus sp. M23 TaxID=3079030 RepID=UPI002A90E911|nr:hypothetical protein [Virgibacillus sp. M23]MDY7043677.1 hypothetical protein [Virgibacillus sp. M23]